MHPPLQPSSFLVTQRFIFFNFLLFFLILSLLCNLPPLIQPLHRLPPLIPSCLATPHPSCLLQRISPLYSHPLNPSSLVTHRLTLFNFLLLLLILFLLLQPLPPLQLSYFLFFILFSHIPPYSLLFPSSFDLELPPVLTLSSSSSWTLSPL